MKQYIGTKVIKAKSMNRLEYNIFRGWELPQDENSSDEGYLVEYVDGGKPNTEAFVGYVSWSPKEQFDNAYKASGYLSFGDAITYMKDNNKLSRKNWNGKDMYIFLIEKLYIKTDTKCFEQNPHLVMRTADGTYVPWLASQSDMLANDWFIYEDLRAG